MSEFEPKQFGKYLLLEKLAVGGMAEIYKAKTYGVDGFEKELAIKRILPHCSADKDFITMLIDEAKLSVMLSHANIVQVYDLGKVGDDYYISMEFIHGVNLRDVMYRCRESGVTIPTDIAVYIISEICKGLDYAHRKTDHNNQPLNIVHRDISPQNILLSYEGEVKIVDFGIAKAAMNISHTMAGILKGKIAYMSPEQAMGKAIDRRTDIFSTGILLYETLTGQKLFTGESQFEVLKKIRTTRITAEQLPNSIPEQLKPIVVKALAYNIDERFQHAGDLQIELTKYLYSKHVDFSPRKLAAFIKDVFINEIRGDQVERVREEVAEGMTASMDVREGMKQYYIVHREGEGESISEETARTGGAREGLLETMVTPATRPPAAPPPPREAPKEEGKAVIKKKRHTMLRIAAALAVIAAGAYLTFRFVPSARFWEEKAPVSPAEEIYGSMNVTSEPAGAEIFLDGKDTGTVTPTVIDKLQAGRIYIVRAEKDDYGPAERSVQISGPERIDVALALSPPTGMLNIITDPPGAAIMLDGRLTGLNTPATLEKLTLGTDLRITLSKPEYEDFEQVVNLTSSRPQKISTKLTPVLPQMGKLVINSTPAGAKVLLDGKDTGRTTPAMIANLGPKKYSVALRMDGYDEWSGSFEVAENKSVPVEAQLLRSGEAAVTPQVPPTEAGLPKAPETPPTTGIPAVPGEAPPVEAQKPPAEEKPAEITIASLKVTSTPPGASITLDGAPTGMKTPATLDRLNAGKSYRVKLDLDGYKSVTRTAKLTKPANTLAMALTSEQPAVTPVQPPAGPTEQPPAEVTPTKVESGKAGTIKVASNPSGADVFINSEFKGKTPLSASVPPGTAQVVVNLEGRARVSKTVTVKPGQTVNLTNIELGDVYAEVSLSSDPPAAQVIFDGQTIPARTPVTVRKVRRDRPHTVTIQMPGYKPWSTSFTLDEGSKSFHATLQPQ